MTRSDFGMAPKSFLYLCKGKIIYQKNPISCSGKVQTLLLYKNIESGFMRINLEKNNKIQKKNDLQFVDSKKNLKFAHLFSGKIVFIYE